MFSNGCELSTALTNVLISISAFFSFLKIRKCKNIVVNKLWRIFYILLFADGILGFLIHGILFNEIIVNILWIILSFLFCLTVNTLLIIFMNKVKSCIEFKNSLIVIILSSILIFSVLLIEIINNLEFLTTFIFYACIVLLLIFISCVYLIYKLNKKVNYCYLIGIIFQIIGGLLLIKSDFTIKIIYDFDNNGIYHLFMVLTIISFYLGNNIENSKK